MRLLLRVQNTVISGKVPPLVQLREREISRGELKGLFVRECAEGSRCSRKTLCVCVCVCVCVWGNVLASGERGFQE